MPPSPLPLPLPRSGRALLGAALAAAATACAPLRGDPTPRLTAAPPPVAEVRLDSATVEDGHLVQAVRLRARDGLTVDLLVKRPAPDAPQTSAAASAAARHPLVLLLGGHHAGRDAARLIPDTRGHAVVALSYPYQGRHRLNLWQAIRAAPAVRRAVLDTPRSVRLALDWLVAQPWADASRVEGVGASLGTPFMTVTTAVDPRITRLWSVHGAGDNYRLLAHGTRAYVGWKPARAVAVRAASALVEARAFDADRWVARVSPRPFVMINATDDERLPRAAIDRLWDAATAPKERVWMPGRHVQRNRPEIVRALVATVLRRMQADAPADAPGDATGDPTAPAQTTRPPDPR